MRLQQKFMLIFSCMIIIPLLIIGGTITVYTMGAIHKIAKDQLSEIADGIYNMCKTSDELIQTKVNSDLKVARYVMNNYGTVRLSKSKRTVTGINQYTKEKVRFTIPTMKINNISLYHNYTIVDMIRNLVGGTCTIFQVVGDGDILRITTNVEKKNGKRAINTFIPRINPDGTPNPVVQTVLKGDTFYGKAYVVNAWYLTAYEPIYYNNTIVGVLYVGVKQNKTETLKNAIAECLQGRKGHVWVVDDKGNYIVSRNREYDNENIWDLKDKKGSYFIRSMITNTNASFFQKYDSIDYSTDDTVTLKPAIAAVRQFRHWGWTIVASRDLKDFNKNIIVLARLSALIGLLVLSIGIFAAIYFSKSITHPIVTLVDAFERVKKGDLTNHAVLQRHDEIGDLANALNDMIERWKLIVAGVSETVQQVSISSEKLSTTAKNLADGAQNQSATVEETSASIEEMTTSISYVAKNAQEQVAAVTDMTESVDAIIASIEAVTAIVEKVNHGALNAVSIADEATETSKETIRRMEKIQESSTQMTQIVSAIRDIADNTSLLALNASIEAARAGEAGRGFAVVADNVSKLAQQSGQQSKEIQALIAESNERVRSGALMVHDLADAIEKMKEAAQESVEFSAVVVSETEKQTASGNRMKESVRNVDDVSKMLSTTTEEQSATADELSKATDKITEISQHVAAASEDMADSSDGLSEQSQKMVELISFFKFT